MLRKASRRSRSCRRPLDVAGNQSSMGMREAKNMGTVTTFEKNLPQKGGPGKVGRGETRTPAHPQTSLPPRSLAHACLILLHLSQATSHPDSSSHALASWRFVVAHTKRL